MNNIINVTIIIFLLVVCYLYIAKHQDENFSGIGDQNAYTNLTCVQEDINDPKSTKHILKVSPNINGNHVTYHKLIHPDRLTKTDGTQFVTYDDLVEIGKNVPCTDGDFSTSLKSIRDPEQKASKLFLKINSSTAKTNKSTWQQQECTIADINNGKTINGKIDNKSHWCYKVHNTILNNLDTICSDKPGKIPANYCKDLKDIDIGIKGYVNSTDIKDTSLKNQVNYLLQNGASSLTKFTRNVSAILQEDTLDNGEYHCFKDNYGNKIDSSGSMCYNIDSTKNITPYIPMIDKNQNIMCNAGDTLQSTICKNASGVAYPPDLTDPTNPKCSNSSDAYDSSGNSWSICGGTGIFDKVDFKPTSKTFGQILYKNIGNDKKCTTDLIKNGKGPIGSRGFCVRAPTINEFDILKKTHWSNNYSDQLNALMFPPVS